jgi:hypothetical protein
MPLKAHLNYGKITKMSDNPKNDRFFSIYMKSYFYNDIFDCFDSSDPLINMNNTFH